MSDAIKVGDLVKIVGLPNGYEDSWWHNVDQCDRRGLEGTVYEVDAGLDWYYVGDEGGKYWWYSGDRLKRLASAKVTAVSPTVDDLLEQLRAAISDDRAAMEARHADELQDLSDQVENYRELAKGYKDKWLAATNA